MNIRHSETGLHFPSGWFKSAWTTTPADYDIIANGPEYTAGYSGRMCKRIYAGKAGTLVITPIEGATANRTIIVAAGTWVDVEAIALGAASTAQDVSIYW
jgi:hypothetical protein